MTQALVTIVAPLALQRVPEAEARIDLLGNPPRDDLKAALDTLDVGDGTHFCSLHAVRSKDLESAYFTFEFSADGTDAQAISRIARAVGPALETVFSLASDWRAGTDLDTYLVTHRIGTGAGLFDSPGLVFAGTPNLSVGRIRSEQRLASRATAILSSQVEDMWALERVEAVRDVLRGEPDFADMLETGTASRPYEPLGIVALVARLALSFVATYLWPFVILVLLLTLIGGLWRASIALGFGATLIELIGGGVKWLLVSAALALVALVVAGLALYGELRSLEQRDSLEERTADPTTLAAMFRRENHYAQNHMLSVTQRKPGFVRWFTARFVFWIIGQLAIYLYRPGFLSDIGTIHFARWVTVPHTRDLLFFSNYDSSWESYLEDFITKAHAGLTGVWSNSIGFPQTENLFQKGATDGERFKRYARQSMIPTRFWYCAYPTLTTSTIRTNAAIRLGLSGALTEDEAVSWLALFGSAARPATKLVSSEIQSIIFGGLRFMRFGTCLLYDLPGSVADARAWLTAIMPNIAFNDGRRLKQKAVVTLALGPDGLDRLGLPEQGLKTFPYAFLGGLANEARARILGDKGGSAIDNWRWGQAAPHAALLIYGTSPEDVAALEAALAGIAMTHGATLTHRVPLKAITTDKREPFGFADGISQPVIRGTYKGLKAADPIHLVEPGEFILGYPDNRGNTPPGPTLPATADPRNILPLVDTTGDFTRNFVDGLRDLGRNGSFLVIRELEQDVGVFATYCRDEATRLQGRLPEPYEITPAFIGAKLVGRWQNGSSIVRHPYVPKMDHNAAHDEHGPRTDTPQSDSEKVTERPTTGPETPHAAAAPVARPAKASHLQDNDFLFGTEDPEALRCPFGAHVRRANPRDSLDPGSQDQIDISNRHRIIRIGRQYEPQADGKAGLFFMCLNGDIERQFEFVQQTWLKSPSFHGLSCEKDPLLGDAENGMCGFTIPSRYGPVRLSPVPAMVATRGGGYFFLPGKRLLDFLAVASVSMVPKLITFAPMIDSETWRLLLRHYGVPYQEEPHAFLWGSMLALIRTGSPQVPALCGAGWTLVGPDAAIDRWDAEQPSGCSLIPADPAMKAVAHADWTLFNGTLATHTARLAYYHMLPHREILIGPFTQGIPPREVTFTRAFYPLQRAILSVLLQLTARNADEALSGIRMILDATEARLRDGRRFLQGDRLTLGDLALAAAAAPIILPEGHSALIPPLPLMPPAFAAIVTEMRTRPAARFVQGVYREVDSWRKSEPNQTSLRDGGTLPGAR